MEEEMFALEKKNMNRFYIVIDNSNKEVSELLV